MFFWKLLLSVGQAGQNQTSLETFKKYFRSGFPSFDPPPPPSPLAHPCSFLSTPSPLPKVRSFGLEFPLSPSISILGKFREKKLIMSTSIFGWTQRLLRSHSGISIKRTPLVHDKCSCYGDVRSTESPSKNQVLKNTQSELFWWPQLRLKIVFSNSTVFTVKLNFTIDIQPTTRGKYF